MTKSLATFGLALLLTAGAQAATINTTMTVRGSGALTGTTFTGTADLTGIGTNLGLAGTFGASTVSPGSYEAVFVITVSSTDKLNVTLTIPATALVGAGNGSAKVTGGTGTYAGATGTFASMPGSGGISGTSLSLTFSGAGTIITTGSGGGGGGGTPVPTISAVQDAASNTPNIAQGSIFIVKGTNLSASGYTPFDVPRPTSSAGVKVTFTPTAGGAGTDSYLVYLYNASGVNQIACILPSTVPTGNYNVTVTNGTVSAPFATQVVASKVGLFTQDSSGSGLASVQNYISASVVDLNRLTTGAISGITISPAKPGQTLLAYGTGIGGFAAGDNNGGAAYKDFSSSSTIQAIVGGLSVPVLYAGRAGYPGEDQINFTLPANVPTGCSVSLQISVNGVLSAPVSIAIAPDSASNACVLPGYTTTQLQKFDNGGTLTTGSFAISQFSITVPSFGSVKSDSISGAFTTVSGFQLGSAASSNPTLIQSGTCTVIRNTSGGGSSSAGSVTNLDAGNITVNRPGGSSLSNTSLKQDASNSYSLTNTEGISIPGGTSFTLPAGTYSLNGAGGKDVGSFNTSISIGSPLTITGGLPNSVTRGAGLTLNWSGGNSSDFVEIVGANSTVTGTGASAITNTVEFICTTTAGQRTFTVPPSILTQLPAGANGTLIVASGTTPATFNASLKAGGSIDAGVFASLVGIGSSPTYQ